MKNNNKNLFTEYLQTIKSKAISIWYTDELSIHWPDNFFNDNLRKCSIMSIYARLLSIL